MSTRSRIALVGVALIIGLAHVPVGHTDAPTIAQTEVNYLLQYVEKSGCTFKRNGSWYDSKRAQAHLREKYDIARTSHQLQSAEEFIEKIATKSSLSGRPYEVRCNGDTITTNRWLHDALTRYRAANARNAPR